MNSEIVIPVAIQIRVDDVGWYNGSDDRHLGRPYNFDVVRKGISG